MVMEVGGEIGDALVVAVTEPMNPVAAAAAVFLQQAREPLAVAVRWAVVAGNGHCSRLAASWVELCLRVLWQGKLNGRCRTCFRYQQACSSDTRW